VFRHMHFYVAPGSLLSASAVTRKMLYLQLFRMMLIDIWTLAEVLDIPNMGTPPDGARTIPERLQAQQMLGIGMPPPSPVNPANKGPGRPPTAQSPPHVGPTGSINESKPGNNK